MATPWWFLAPGVLLADALLTPLGRAVPGLLLRHALMAWDAERPDVRHCALAAPLRDGHDVVGIPVGAAAKKPPIALAELGTCSPLLLGPRSLDPVPFRAESLAQLGGIDAAEGTDTVVAAEHALTHQRRAVSGRPVINASFAAEATAPLWNLGVAVAAQRATVWPSRKRLSLDPSGLGADPAGTHAGSIRIANFAMGSSRAGPLRGHVPSRASSASDALPIVVMVSLSLLALVVALALQGLAYLLTVRTVDPYVLAIAGSPKAQC